MRHEPLAATGVRPRERHADRATAVANAIDLVANRVARAAAAGTGRVAVLENKVGHHSMPPPIIEIAAACQTDEIVHRQGCVSREQLDQEYAALSCDTRPRSHPAFERRNQQIVDDAAIYATAGGQCTAGRFQPELADRGALNFM